MSVIRSIISISTSVLLLAGPVLAQDAAVKRGGAQGPAVAASSTTSGVRFVAPGAARRVRLEVYTADGSRVFDSGFRAGGILDWDGRGLSDGSYLCVLTAEDLEGGQSRKLSSATVASGRAALGKEAEEQLKVSYAQAIAAAGLGQDELAGRAKKSNAVTVTAHDGQDGQVTSTTGALTFRTGDIFSGKEQEQMRVTPEGRVGIGTNAPEDTLDVAGTIRARGGIRFDDGTVLTSANGLKTSTNFVVAGTNASGDVPTSNASGVGTVNRLSKWMDGAGTLGDSVITESGGNLGIGTTSPSNRLDIVRGSAGTMAKGFYEVGSFEYNGDMKVGVYSSAASNPNAALSFGSTNLQVNSRFPGFELQYLYGATAAANQMRFNYIERDSAGQVTKAAANLLTVKGNGDVTLNPFLIGLTAAPRLGIGTDNPTQALDVNGNVRVGGAGNGIIFPDGTKQTTAGGAGGSMTGTSIVSAINDAGTSGLISEARLSPNVAKLNAQNNWTGQNTFNGLSLNNTNIVNLANPVSATDAVNKAYADANFVKFVPGAEQLSVGDANGTAPMINLRGGSTCCSGPGGHTPAFFKVFQNGSFVATGNLGIGTSPMEGKGYRTSWHTYKGAFRSGYADNEWDDANVGFFSWAGGSNSTASGLYALAFGDTNSAESTSSIVFGSGNQVKGAAGFSAGAGNRVCDTYGVALGNNAKSGGPYINGKCDPETFNLRGLAAIAIGYNVTADQDHTTAMGKFASNNGFQGTFIWSDGSAQASADTFRNTANNEFAARATGGFRFRTNLGGTTGCNLPAGSGVFNCTSSRATKENFFDVNGDDVLAKLRKVPVSTWNYIAEGQQSRHLGPMAEDFYTAFQLGTTDKAIGIQDAVGVSLAAVKALDAKTLELQQKAEEVEQLRTKVNTLEQRLAALEALMQKQAEGQK
ncbi:MAG TPA: tail fiber domain-containing protein [Pyrinomonadaceae bacterium]